MVLDACVLANFSLCDTLLRLAEPPRLFEARWSDEIIAETTRTLRAKLGWSIALTAHFETELRTHFTEAWVSGYEPLLPRVRNDAKDRHVVAAAIQAEAPFIVTFKLRHFRSAELKPWGIQALHPQTFLREIFLQERSLVMEKLRQQATDRNRTMGQLLKILDVTVPEFVALVFAAL